MGQHLKEGSIIALIQKRAQELPEHIAIKHHEKEISYNNLVIQVQQFATFLSSLSLKRNDVVAVAMDRSIEMSICLLGLLQAGITYLPIDPTLPLDRVDFLIKDSNAKQLITTAKYKTTYTSFEPLVFEDSLMQKKVLTTYSVTANGEDSLVYIVYTSGSTGLPKGVGVSESNLLNLLKHRLVEPGLGPEDNMLGLTTMSFDISEEELYLPLVAGARLTIVDHDITRDGAALLQVVKDEQITLMQATPYIWQMMMEAGWTEKLPLIAFCGGEALNKNLAHQLLQRCKSLWNMYGPTETTICALAKQLQPNDELITIGKPISNTNVYILDENLVPVKPGEEGELYISGLGVTNGYINRPDLNKIKFLKDPFAANADQTMYKTGDLVKVLANKELQFIGRIDTQIKIRGYRIETEEIDHQLKAQPEIKDALVAVHYDSAANARLIAYVTLMENVEKVSFSKIRNQIKAELTKVLPIYMVPIDYLLLESMPLLPSGKIDRKALPRPVIQIAKAEYRAPLTANEQLLSQIWSACIGVKKIGLDDNFFDLGGNSLMALKTKIAVEQQLGKRLSPSILFKYPTIRKLVEHLINDETDDYRALVPIQPEGNKIPLYIVHGIGLNVLGYKDMVTHLSIDQPVYGLQAFAAEEFDVYSNIETIANFYNSEILKHNPEGPYAIGGYSIGGIIAFEMVKQLQAKGKVVKLLAIFDTNIQIPTHQFKLWPKVLAKSIRQYKKLNFRLKSIYDSPIKNFHFLLKKYYNNVRWLFNNKMDFVGYPKYMLNIIDKIMKAFFKYTLTPESVTIDVFKAQNLFFMDDAKYLGWKEYALNGVNVHLVSGNHKEMFEATHVGILAKKLQARLDEINA